MHVLLASPKPSQNAVDKASCKSDELASQPEEAATNDQKTKPKVRQSCPERVVQPGPVSKKWAWVLREPYAANLAFAGALATGTRLIMIEYLV